jgi:protein gp37
MGKNTSIEWCHHTFNPWWGCTKVSAACKNCYAERFAKRTGRAAWGDDAPRVVGSDKLWSEPRRWNLEAWEQKERKRVFCASMADVFEGRSDLDVHRARLWELIADTPMLDWLLLTKRPENIKAMVPAEWQRTMPFNVWLGTTVENAEEADRRIHHLYELEPTVRFLSCEPLLGALPLNRVRFPGAMLDVLAGCGVATRGTCGQSIPNVFIKPIDWVIAGGESGPGARPMHPDWARMLRDECRESRVAFFMKQWGEWAEAGAHDLERGAICYVAIDGSVRRGEDADAPRGSVRMVRTGKAAAGRLLDGIEHSATPSTCRPEPVAEGKHTYERELVRARLGL